MSAVLIEVSFDGGRIVIHFGQKIFALEVDVLQTDFHVFALIFSFRIGVGHNQRAALQCFQTRRQHGLTLLLLKLHLGHSHLVQIGFVGIGIELAQLRGEFGLNGVTEFLVGNG